MRNGFKKNFKSQKSHEVIEAVDYNIRNMK